MAQQQQPQYQMPAQLPVQMPGPVGPSSPAERRTVSWSPGILSASGEAATFVSRSKITANLTLYTITIWADPIYSCTAFITTSRAFEPFRKHISATYISRAILKRPYHTRFEPPVAL
ncbi:hypothetical protein VE04_01683 [Pseudogymnoascus sp. 24MN13]|nr:hypothetical protein VE04_01683 [Pseudogymnoascus sp. 24MN13]